VAEEWFGPYRLLALLGRGGMGEVWRAVDTSHDGRVVALKLLGTWLGDDPVYAQRFRREAAMAARLGSPHVVPIHRYGEIGRRLYLDMQLVEGTDLADVLRREGRLPPWRAVELMVQAARGLGAAHAAGLVHRDVKPSNILITSDAGEEHVYVIDFGIARSVDSNSVSQAVIGTLAYMAPERFVGDGDHRADVYALGAVLHEALTGQPPFPTSNPFALINSHQHAPPPRPSAMRPDLPPALDEVVGRALAKQPQHRYASVAEFATAARAALAPRTALLAAAPHGGPPWPPAGTAAPPWLPPSGVPAGPPPWPQQGASPGKPPRRGRAIALVTAAVVAVLGLVAATVLLGAPAQGPSVPVTTTPTPTVAVGDPVGWTNRVCGVLLPLVKVAATEPTFDQNDPAAAVRALSNYLGGALSAVDQALTGLDAVGPAPVPAGDTIVGRVKQTLTTVRTAFDRAKTATDELDPTDLVELATKLPQAVAPLKDLQKLEDPTADLKTDPVLEAAAATAPNCQTLNKVN